VANVYMLADGSVVVRYVGTEERTIAVRGAPQAPPEEWTGERADPNPAELEAMVARVLVSDHCTDAAAAGASVWKAVRAYLEARHFGGSGILGILGPAKLLRPKPPESM
jgi:hypothetical protein